MDSYKFNLAVSTVGVLATTCQFILNSLIIVKFLRKGTLSRTSDFQLILFRVILDAVNGCIYALYYTFIVLNYAIPQAVPLECVFSFGLIVSNLLEIRSFLAAGIAIERALATLFPAAFYRHRGKIPNIIMVIFFVSTGISSDIALFGYCESIFPLDSTCSTFICATSKCFQNYLAETKMIYTTINAVFSIILCTKLLHLSVKKNSTSTNLRKANYICLADGLSCVVFELIPAMLVSIDVWDLATAGPLTGVLRSIGRSIEAVVMYKLMSSGETNLSSVSSNNNFNINTNKKNQSPVIAKVQSQNPVTVS